MADEKKLSTKWDTLLKWGGRITVGLLTFLFAFVFNTILDVKERIKVLEADKESDMAQWRAIKNVSEKQQESDVEVKVIKKLIEAESKTRPIRIDVKLSTERELKAAPVKPKPDDTAEKLRKALEDLKKKESVKDFRDRYIQQQEQMILPQEKK